MTGTLSANPQQRIPIPGSLTCDLDHWNPIIWGPGSAKDPIGIWAPGEALREAPVGDIWEAPGKHLGRYLGGDRGRPWNLRDGGEGGDLGARALN